ncbi:MAG: hypothetical protein FJZ90_01000 [Chloroflexi bacterium]|nr:hypothetical protein [Chloroflexota bacterium]
MSRQFLHRGLLVIALLSLGALLARFIPAPGASEIAGLGEVLWLERRADLLIQMGLMLVGALGIRSLLPGEEEEEEAHDDVLLG